MKPISQGFLVFLFFVLLVSYLPSARDLNPKLQQGIQKVETEKAAETEDISNVMGVDELCEHEECNAERKLLAEAHLDYIYTQKHTKP